MPNEMEEKAREVFKLMQNAHGVSMIEKYLTEAYIKGYEQGKNHHWTVRFNDGMESAAKEAMAQETGCGCGESIAAAIREMINGK